MSRKLLGALGKELGDILDVEGGQVSIDQLRDREGLGLVWDMSRTAEASLLVGGTRGFDTGNMAQSSLSAQTITGLPSLSRIVAAEVKTDTPARVTQVFGTMRDLASGREQLIYYWENGDPTITLTAASDVDIGDDPQLTSILRPPILRLPQIWIAADSQVQRQGFDQIRWTVRSTAFGAGTVRVTGHIQQLFWIGLGGRSNPVGVPSW